MTKSAAAKPARMGRPRDRELDRRIVAATIEVFLRTGWRDLSIDEVARRAGVGKASVYLRWKDKAELLREALSASYRPWVIAPSGSLRSDLEALVAAILSELSVEAGWAINRARSDVDVPHGIKDLCQTLIAERLSGIGSLVLAAKVRGEVSANVSTDLIIEAVTGAALGHAGLWLFEGTVPSQGEAAEYARRLVDFLYPAITNGVP